MLAALIPAAASLLGGFANRRATKKANARAEAYQDPKNIRARYEAAGFNPLLGMQGSPGTVWPGMVPTMGDSIANAGMLLSQGITQRQQQVEAENSALRTEKEALQTAAQNSVIRPTVPGLYGQAPWGPGANEATPRYNPAPRGAPRSARPDETASPAPAPVGGAGGGRGVEFGPPVAPLEARGIDGTNPNLGAQFTAFGVDFAGSGDFSGGETWEAALGESELMSTLMWPVLAGDAVGHTLGERLNPYMIHTSTGRTLPLNVYSQRPQQRPWSDPRELLMTHGANAQQFWRN